MNLSKDTFSVFPCGMAKGLTPGEQVALAWLWHHKMVNGASRLPSLNELAGECGMTKRSLITQLQSLVARKLIAIDKSEQDGRPINTYTLPVIGEVISPIACELKVAEKAKWSAAPYLDIWKEAYGGYFPVDRCSMALKRAERDHGGQQVVADGLKRYCKHMQMDRAQFASIHHYCSKIGQWLNQKKERVYDGQTASGERKW